MCDNADRIQNQTAPARPSVLWGVLAGALALLVPGTGASATNLSFKPHVDYGARGISYNIALSDLNRDGKLDLVIPGFVPPIGKHSAVSVLLGNGNGTFQSKRDYAVGGAPSKVEVVDLNRDGKPDLVIVGGSESVSVLLGNGNGNFQSKIDVPTLGMHDLVSVADLNRDGKLDVVTASSSYVLNLLMGNGDGTFQPRVDLMTNGPCVSLTVADLNRDGKPDVVTRYPSNVSVWLGNADGTVKSEVEYAVAPSGIFVDAASGVLVADLNRDGKPDLATQGDETVSVLFGKGDGAFKTHEDLATGGHVNGIAVADLNRDGSPDLVTRNQEGTVSVLLGKGNGTYKRYTDYATGQDPQSLAVADLNRDGKSDLLTVNGDVTVLLGKGNGSFESQMEFATAPFARWLAVGDLNRDGRIDVVTGNYTQTYRAAVSVLINNTP